MFQRNNKKLDEEEERESLNRTIGSLHNKCVLLIDCHLFAPATFMTGYSQSHLVLSCGRYLEIYFGEDVKCYSFIFSWNFNDVIFRG